jgi:hypothetical protein
MITVLSGIAPAGIFIFSGMLLPAYTADNPQPAGAPVHTIETRMKIRL